MISTFSKNAPFITLSVGNEIRLRDGHTPGTGDVQRTSANHQTPRITTDSTEGKKIYNPINKEHLQAIVARLQDALKHVEPRVELSVDDDMNQVIFRIVDKESGDLIRQIPPENVLELDRFLSGQSGMFVEEDI
jgi:flagellar protein FlaG